MFDGREVIELCLLCWVVVVDDVEWMEKGKSERWEDGLFVVQKALASDLAVIALVGGCAFRVANPAIFELVTSKLLPTNQHPAFNLHVWLSEE